MMSSGTFKEQACWLRLLRWCGEASGPDRWWNLVPTGNPCH